MSKPINEIIESLDKNIKNLKNAEEINMHDVKTLLIDLFGTIRDMWETFEDIFKRVKDVMKLEVVEKLEKINENQDLKFLYL